ncbi:putative protein TPRXL [Tripterygium wilfordii]|uniref:Uncharacterized protein n=1 Tax=Tripterygium wilfordii TaxID=458696 RepID=A0A7J7CMD8_TRIWF|nr:nucleolar protein dao-5 [Tripterygium wilfordii]KAF5735233.1 putative protein TPRXL [Tripterygium wilfordii]
MTDSGFLSDTDESAVEELISQAQELCVLEQVSAINCSGFTDSDLPSELENRFRKLKSFPLTKSGYKVTGNSRCDKALYGSKSDLSKSEVNGEAEDDGAVFGERSGGFSDSKKNPVGNLGSVRGSRSGYASSPSNSDIGDEQSSAEKKNPTEKKGLEKKLSKHRSISSSSDSSSNDLTENAIFSPSKQTPDVKKKSKSKLNSGSFSSPVASPNSWMDSPSPPRKTGCFWCSPKKVPRQKSRESKALDMDLEWGKNDDLLSDLGTFSVKEQQKILKMAMKEQQKISHEAEKIVKWAKQASARMNFHDIEDELSDDEIIKRA